MDLRNAKISHCLRFLALVPSGGVLLGSMERRRRILWGSRELSTSPSSPRSCSSISSSVNSMSPLNTSSGVLFGCVDTLPPRRENGAATVVDKKAEALSMKDLGLLIGTEARIYFLLCHPFEVALPGGGYAGSHENDTEISCVSWLNENCGSG